jgi:MFS family permease
MSTLILTDEAATRATPSADRDHRWLGLAVIATAQLMIALDATVVNIALPSAQASLGFEDADRQWVVTAYTLALGGLLLLGGRIADSVAVGRRRALMIGLVGFAAASALSGAAVSMGMLIGARALQGAFAALLAPTALSSLALMFSEPRERGRAFGIYGAIAASGGALGLLLGGLLTQYLSWRWCLYVNVPIALVAAACARTVLPETRRPPTQAGHVRWTGGVHGRASARSPGRQPTGTERFDVLGLLLGSGGLVAVVLGCGQAARLGWSAPQVLVLFAVGAVALGMFVWQEARAEAPVLPLGIVLDRQRGAAYASALLAAAGMFGAFLFLTYTLQVGMGFTPLGAGLAFLPMTTSSVLAGTLLAPRLLPRVGPRVLIVTGFVLAASGMAVLTQLQAGSAYATAVLPAEILLGLGIASVMVPASQLATSRVDQRTAGIASATLNSAQQVGASLGTTVLNTLAATATAAYLASGGVASPADGLVHGYAAAALWGAVVLLVGAAVALCMPAQSDTRRSVEGAQV